MNEVVPLTLPLRDSQPVDTSGTVGTTVVDTITVIERAAARCGKPATSLTPEDLDTAKTNLFFILSRLATRGFNLWAVEQFYLPVINDKLRYALPPATEGIVNIMYRTVQRLAATATLAGGTAATLTFTEMSKVAIVGFKLPADISSRFIMEATVNGTDWTTVQNFNDITLSAGWHWYTLDAAVTCTGFRLRDTADNALTVSDMLTSSTAKDMPVTRYNRDDYTGLNNKFQRGLPTCYYYEKKIESAISFWPMPNDDTGHFVLWRHRAVQDVGSLSGKLEIPDRWLDALVWMLAKNLAFELSGVDKERIPICIQQADTAENAAELGESDGAPMRMQPNISGYTA